MKVKGPLLTLGVVAVLGAGILIANISQESDPAAPSTPVAQSSPNPAPTSTVPSPPPTPRFPAKADYVGKIPIKTGEIALEITVDGTKAVAYACDGNTIETWLSGSAENGVLKLAGKAKTSRLEGRLDGSAVNGTLWIGEKKWNFTTTAAEPPAGLYVYTERGVRSSWIIDANAGVTGVQRRADGSTAPAPRLSIDGTALIEGRTVEAIRVEGDSNDVF